MGPDEVGFGAFMRWYCHRENLKQCMECVRVQECVFEVSMAAEAFMELMHMHYGRVLLASAEHVSKAEALLRSAVKAEDELRRLCVPCCCISRET